MWKNPQELTGQLPWHIQQQKAIAKKVEDEDTHLRSSSDPYTHIKAESCQVGGAYRNTQRERIGRVGEGRRKRSMGRKRRGRRRRRTVKKGRKKRVKKRLLSFKDCV